MNNNVKFIAHFDDGYFETMPDRSWRRLSVEEAAEAEARSAARVAAYLETRHTGLAGKFVEEPSYSSLIVVLSLIIGACLGCAATIAAYALHLL